MIAASILGEKKIQKKPPKNSYWGLFMPSGSSQKGSKTRTALWEIEAPSLEGILHVESCVFLFLRDFQKPRGLCLLNKLE